MANEKQKCPMCSTKLKMINGRMTCKSCGYYYRNPNEQANYNPASYGSGQQSAYGTGQRTVSGGQYGAGQKTASGGQYGAGQRTVSGGQAKTGNGSGRDAGKTHVGPVVSVIASVVLIIVVRVFITLYNDGFFQSDPPFDNRDRLESMANSISDYSSRGEGDEGLASGYPGYEESGSGDSDSWGDESGTETGRLPESEFFQMMAEAVWEKDYRTITESEYASLTALEINRDEKTIFYRLNRGDSMSLTFDSDAGKKLSDLTCFRGLEYLCVDDELEEGDLDGLNELYSVKSENSIDEMLEIVPNRENILELAVEDPIFSNSLEGIQAFSNLEYLSVDYGALEDISALSECTNLQGLALIDCDRLMDYSPLMQLTGLKELCIEAAQLKSIDFIREMPDLTLLAVEDSVITDLDALADCPAIDTLSLTGNYRIEDFTGINSLENLVDLTLELNYSNNMPSFENLGGLERLSLKYANDLSVLRNAPKVTWLCLEECSSQELEAITSMQDLAVLEIHGFSYYTESLEPLTRLPKLEVLDLEDTYIYGNINEIFGISTLTYLNLSEVRGVVDFRNLPENENLQYLLLNRASLADAETYDEWGGWEGVKLKDHYELFRSFPNLIQLSVAGQELEDIAFVEGLPGLQYLDITDNYVTSLKPLEELKDFQGVVCGGNTILEGLSEDSGIRVIMSE